MQNSIKIFTAKEKTEKQNLSFLNKNSCYSVATSSNSFDSFEPKNNNGKNSSNNSTIETMRNSDNDNDHKNIFVINKLNEENNNINNNITLLGKKTKIYFNTIKQNEKKKTFLTTKYMQKAEEILKEKNLKKNNNKIYPKKNLFQTIKYFFLDNKKQITDGGRWTYEEHIKFIKAFVNYGKRWKTIQKYIGTRSCPQIRSHAQKFLLRLKALKSDKCNFDFKKDNIQSLADVINLIAKKNKKNYNNKEFIINAIITLTTLNLQNKGKKFFEKKKDDIIIEIKKKKEDAVNNNISEIDEDFLIKNNNKDIELDYLNSDDLIEDEDIVPNKENNLDEKDINNNILLELKENNMEPNNDEIAHIENYNNNYEYMDIPINHNFNNNSFLFSDDSSLGSFNNAAIEPMEKIFKKNIKSSFSKFMNKFFS